MTVSRTLAVFTPLALAAAAPAATFQWDGSGSVNWNNAANWTLTSGSDGDGVPDTDDVVEMHASGAGNLATNNDRTAGSSSTATLSGLIFLDIDNATAATIAGSAISFGAGTTGVTVQTEAGNPTVTAALTTTTGNNLTINVATGQTLTTGNINVNGTATLNLNSSGTVKVGGTLGGSSFNMIVDTDAGTLDLFGANGSINRLTGSGGTITSTSGSTRTLTTINASADATTDTLFSDNLNIQIGRGNFADTNTRTQTFTANSTYTGTTTVLTGTLKIDGTTSGQGNYVVSGRNGGSIAAAAATLAGTGTIGLAATRTVTVDYVKGASVTGTALATITPGTAGTVGTLTLGTASHTGVSANALIIGGSAALSQGGQYLADIAAAGSSDRIALHGNLNLSNTNDRLQLSSLLGAFDGSDYTLLTFTGARTGKFSSVFLDAIDITTIAETGFTANSNTYQLVYDGTSNGSIKLMLIPEPASLVLAAAGLLLMTVRRRAC